MVVVNPCCCLLRLLLLAKGLLGCLGMLALLIGGTCVVLCCFSDVCRVVLICCLLLVCALVAVAAMWADAVKGYGFVNLLACRVG